MSAEDMSTQRPNQTLICRTPTHPLADFVERLWLVCDAPAHSKERIAATGTIELGINLHENEFWIYDPAKPERYRRLSGERKKCSKHSARPSGSERDYGEITH
jgi:hypothetical protein